MKAGSRHHSSNTVSDFGLPGHIFRAKLFILGDSCCSTGEQLFVGIEGVGHAGQLTWVKLGSNPWNEMWEAVELVAGPEPNLSTLPSPPDRRRIGGRNLRGSARRERDCV